MKFNDAVLRAVNLFSSKSFIKEIENEDNTMLKHLSILQHINKKRLLTTQSQAGRKRKGKTFEIHEKAYIIGFMLESEASLFIKNLSLFTDKNAVWISECDDDKRIPAMLDMPLTVSVKGDKVDVVTHMSMIIPRREMERMRDSLLINKNENVVCILCWDSKWNRNASSNKGLFTDILKVLTFN